MREERGLARFGKKKVMSLRSVLLDWLRHGTRDGEQGGENAKKQSGKYVTRPETRGMNKRLVRTNLRGKFGSQGGREEVIVLWERKGRGERKLMGAFRTEARGLQKRSPLIKQRGAGASDGTEETSCKGGMKKRGGGTC